MTAHSFVRRGVVTALAALAAVSLAGCIGGLSGPMGAPEPAPPQQVTTGETLGTGSVRVALLLPLSGPGAGAAAAASLRNAAEMALEEFQGPDITILVKDDQGTPEGARLAAEEAIADGAELILGPLFAPAVQAVGAVARQSGVPVIAFSTDATVATRGVYLMGFLPQTEVERVVEYASLQGRRSVAGLIPETVYGNVVEAQFREAAARRGLRVAAIERYAAGQAGAAVSRLAPVIGGAAPQADALFVPETPEGIGAVGQALQSAGYDPQRVRPLGTGVWSDSRVFSVPALQGGWFAAPEQAGYQAFAERYRQRYGAEPVRIATLAYDAVSLAAALTRTQGTQRFAESVIASPSGFAGADGVFRFNPLGTNERGLAVMEIRGAGAGTVSPAPRTLGTGGA